MKLTNANKYFKALKSIKLKVVTADKLSKETNIRVDVILDDLSIFDPLLKMFGDSYNLKKFLTQLETYIEQQKSLKPSKPKTKKAKKLETNITLKQYLYDRILLAGGFIDRTYEFSRDDYRQIKAICLKELKKEKKK